MNTATRTVDATMNLIEAEVDQLRPAIPTRRALPRRHAIVRTNSWAVYEVSTGRRVSNGFRARGAALEAYEAVTCGVVLAVTN